MIHKFRVVSRKLAMRRAEQLGICSRDTNYGRNEREKQKAVGPVLTRNEFKVMLWEKNRRREKHQGGTGRWKTRDVGFDDGPAASFFPGRSRRQKYVFNKMLRIERKEGSFQSKVPVECCVLCYWYSTLILCELLQMKWAARRIVLLVHFTTNYEGAAETERRSVAQLCRRSNDELEGRDRGERDTIL